MINLEKFVRECCRPYDEADCNCATAVAAGLNNPPRLSKALAEWRDLPARERAITAQEFAAGGAIARSIAIRCGLKSADKEGRSPAWGAVRVAGKFSFAIYDGSRWWVRGETGARRICSRYVVAAWEIA